MLATSFRQGTVMPLRPDACHERRVLDPDEHLAIHKKRKATKHLSLRDAGPADECFTDALSETEVVGHVLWWLTLDVSEREPE